MLTEEGWRRTRHAMSMHFRLAIYRQALDRLAPEGVNQAFLAEVREIIEQVQKSSPR